MAALAKHNPASTGTLILKMYLTNTHTHTAETEGRDCEIQGNLSSVGKVVWV